MNEYNSANASPDVITSNSGKRGNIQHLCASNYEETNNSGGSL